jgi:hypothetical protein
VALPALREPSNVRGRGSKSAGEKLYPSLPSWTSGEGQSALASGQALASQYFRPTVDEGGCFMVFCFLRLRLSESIGKHINP